MGKQRGVTPFMGCLLGLLLFTQGGYVQAKAWLAQHLIERAWQQSLIP